MLNLDLSKIQDNYTRDVFRQVLSAFNAGGITGPRGLQGPTGPAGIPGTAGDTTYAPKLKITKQASTNISALKGVYLDTDTTCALADKSSILTSTVIGITITSALALSDIDIVLFGEISDGSFTYAENEPLYLGTSGNITNIPPSSGILAPIGFGLGTGSIFVKIDKTITL